MPTFPPVTALLLLRCHRLVILFPFPLSVDFPFLEDLPWCWASAVTLPRPEAAGRDDAAVKNRGTVSEDMSLAGGKAKKCLNNMTIFNQENVEEFYEIGNELGR